MKPSLRLACLLTLLTGGAMPPQGDTTRSVPTIGWTADRHGYVINPQHWHCARILNRGTDCELCVNISSHVAELSTGELLDNGHWDVTREWFRPGSQVTLCRPTIPLLAQSF